MNHLLYKVNVALRGPMMLLLASAVAAQAQFDFVTNNGTITITAYTGPGGAVVIPATTNGLPVVSVGSSAFLGTSITSVTIPDSVISIADYAFGYCNFLTNASIGTNVTSIGDYAFVAGGRSIGLATLAIPNSTTNLGASAFSDQRSLTSLTIPDNVISLGEGVFSDCHSLTNVIVGNGVVTIGNAAFEGCDSLTTLTLGNHVVGIGDYAFSATFYGLLTHVTIPNSVTNIGINAFSFQSSLTNVTIPRSVMSIGDHAFWNCGLGSAVFQGNAPPDDGTVFGYNPDAIVYYLPGTTGWGPQVQTGDASFGVLSNQFGFTIAGTPNIPLVIEAATNLVFSVWVPVQSCTLTNGLFHFSDPAWTNYPVRFYRFRWP
jgi:BspA type Leucine rich repeat region (6 copies)